MTCFPLTKPLMLMAAAWMGFLGEPVCAQDTGKQTEITSLVYTGESLQLPLECRYDDLLRAGLVCNQDTPCDLSLELVAVRAAKTRVFAIGNVYAPAATVSSVLLASHDSGTTWAEAVERIPTASLEIIQFVDDEDGWVGGQEKDIDNSSLPFFFITQDGGRYWDRYDVWDTSEERSGAILEFHFESPRHGYLVIERLAADEDSYELYETMNSGHSWSVREISGQRPTIRRRISMLTEAEWRLTEDQSAGTYAIEKRDGNTWRKTASFFSNVGTCTEMDTGEEKPQETLLQQQQKPKELADPQRPVQQQEGGVLVVPGAR